MIRFASIRTVAIHLLRSTLWVIVIGSLAAGLLVGTGFLMQNLTTDFVQHGMPLPQASSNAHLALLFALLLVLAGILPPLIRLAWHRIHRIWTAPTVAPADQRSVPSCRIEVLLLGGISVILPAESSNRESEILTTLTQATAAGEDVTILRDLDGPIRIPGRSIVCWSVSRSGDADIALPRQPGRCIRFGSQQAAPDLRRSV